MAKDTTKNTGTSVKKNEGSRTQVNENRGTIVSNSKDSGALTVTNTTPPPQPKKK